MQEALLYIAADDIENTSGGNDIHAIAPSAYCNIKFCAAKSEAALQESPQ